MNAFQFSCCILMLVATVPKALTLSAAEPSNLKAPAFRFQDQNDSSIGLWEGSKPVLVYNHGFVSRAAVPTTRPRSCYIHPVYGLDGEILTDDFPKDHVYHRGMYWAWPHIRIGEREYDLWSNRGELQQQFRRWIRKEASPEQAKLGVENAWTAGNQDLVREEVWLTVQPADDTGRAIDIELTWTPVTAPLTLWGAEGKSYGGFNFRFGPRTKTVITVPKDAVLPAGSRSPDGVMSDDLVMTPLPWADMSGDFAGAEKISGAAIFVHPGHAEYPPTWMLRHYGLLSVGWPGVKPQTFPIGKPITCRYRLWIHRGSPTADEIEAVYRKYRDAAATVEARSPR